MILLDTNIIIYSALENHKNLREFFKNSNAGCSMISHLEVLGYHKITPEQIKYFEAVFELAETMPITEDVIQQAITFRKKHSMSVADSIIAATAKVYNATLYTNNIKDFAFIKEIKLYNPMLT